MTERTSHKSRFADNKLWENPYAPIRHFVSQITEGDPIQRDRFGNRIFTSPFKSYLDREGNPTKASLLVSPEGEAFIKRHPRILSDIDRGLIALTTQYEPNSIYQPLQSIHLSRNRRMERFENTNIGGQSTVFLLQVYQKKYVVKIKSLIRSEVKSISQPYINEMLQAQTLATNLQKKLAKEGIIMPTFLFASGQVSCTQFEEGNPPNGKIFERKVGELSKAIKKYCNPKSNGLWGNIIPDFNSNNFIQRADGIIVWIDPFYYLET